jgi:hypothetical protein
MGPAPAIMLKLLSIFCAWLALRPANAQVGSSASQRDFAGGALQVTPGVRVGSPQFQADFKKFPSARVQVSLSRQFIIRDPPSANGFFPTLDLSAVPHLVRFEPTLLAVSCERIKKALLEVIEARDHWRGAVFLELHPARSVDETIVITSFLGDGEWTYCVDLPDTLQAARLVSAVVQVLLLEMANRNSGNCAELPAWLAEGLTRQIILSSDVDLVLESPKGGWSLNSLSWRKSNPLARAHDELRDLAPLTLAELSWPGPGQLDGEAGEAYRSSAQLFVYELLRLERGPACLRTFIERLPGHLNWQISLLDAFRSHFGGQLDLEKWWALQLVDFTGRDPSQTWPSGESWRKLDEIIRPPVQIRTKADELPLRAEVTLQTIVREWEYSRQSGILREKIQQLLLLRLKVSQDLVPLVDDYRRTLESYLRNKEKMSVTPMGRRPAVRGADGYTRDTVERLDWLDTRREALRAQPKPPRTDTAAIPSNN